MSSKESRPANAIFRRSRRGCRRQRILRSRHFARQVVREFGQLYRDRGDSEKISDELKNQWGWGGFVTQDLARCQLAARLVALFHDWWNTAFVWSSWTGIWRRSPVGHCSACHCHAGAACETNNDNCGESSRPGNSRREGAPRRRHFSSRETAEQLTGLERWRQILARAFQVLLQGRQSRSHASAQLTHNRRSSQAISRPSDANCRFQVIPNDAPDSGEVKVLERWCDSCGKCAARGSSAGIDGLRREPATAKRARTKAVRHAVFIFAPSATTRSLPPRQSAISTFRASAIIMNIAICLFALRPLRGETIPQARAVRLETVMRTRAKLDDERLQPLCRIAVLAARPARRCMLPMEKVCSCQPRIGRKRNVSSAKSCKQASGPGRSRSRRLRIPYSSTRRANHSCARSCPAP